MKEFAAECVFQTDAVLGEGPAWDSARAALWWVDIERHQVHLWSPDNGDRLWQLEHRVGFVIPTTKGDVVVGTQPGLARLDPADGKGERVRSTGFGLPSGAGSRFEDCRLTMLSTPEPHLPENRFNDAKCDAAGRLWAGTMACSEAPERGSLYRFGSDYQPLRMVERVSISNGLAWSLDGRTMYYIDSSTRRVDAFDFEPKAGTLSNRRTVIRIPKGFPDGMCIDADGNLWIALWGGWGVACYDPRSGLQLAEIALPVEAVTSCCFGGASLDDLYITTASRDLDAAGHARQPLAGSIFRARVGVKGTATNLFAG